MTEGNAPDPHYPHLIIALSREIGVAIPSQS